jgi:DNA repair ATPase RecN
MRYLMVKDILKKIVDLHSIKDDLSFISKNRRAVLKASRITDVTKRTEKILGLKNQLITLTRHIDTIKSIDLKIDLRFIENIKDLAVKDFNKLLKDFSENRENLRYVKDLNFKLRWFKKDTIDNIEFVVKNITPLFIKKLINVNKHISDVDKFQSKIEYEYKTIKGLREEFENKNREISDKLKDIKKYEKELYRSLDRVQNIKPILNFVDDEKNAKVEYDKLSGKMYFFLPRVKNISTKKVIRSTIKYDVIGLFKNISKFSNRKKGFIYFAEDRSEMYIKNSAKNGDWSSPIKV